LQAAILQYEKKQDSALMETNKLEDFQSEEGRKIPDPFIIVNGSLYKRESKKEETLKMISRKVPAITKEFLNIERPHVMYEIEWNERNKKVREIVPASTIAIKKELLELSLKGLSVNENNAKSLIEYLDLFLNCNVVEQFTAVERLGLIKDHFVHPLLRNDIEIVAVDDGEYQIKDGFEIKGTSHSWKLEVFERIRNYPKAVFFVLASFASVIIKDLGIPPFIVDLSGATSQGKTTTLKVAASVWGKGGLINEWNATKVSIERKAAYLNSFPLLMDDTRKADEKVLNVIIYQFSGGKSKGRGSLNGNQKEYTWNNILLSTGEVSLNEYAKNQGGIAARVIPLVDQPLRNNHEDIMQLIDALENNYGAIGIDFLKLWMQEKNELLPGYHRSRLHFIKRAKGKEVLNRLAGYYSAVYFTGCILKNKLGIDVNLEELLNLFEEIAQDNRSIDMPMQFFEEILTDLDSNRLSIYYPGSYKPNVMNAIYRNKTLYLHPKYIKSMLAVEERQIRKEWLKRGLTIGKSENGSFVDYKSIKHEGQTYRVVEINMDYVRKLGFDFNDNKYER
jgi:putative DNA primase/helicase